MIEAAERGFRCWFADSWKCRQHGCPPALVRCWPRPGVARAGRLATEIAAELASVLAAVQATRGRGPSADRFAHQPFRYWLTHAATVATTGSRRAQTAAAGYTSIGGMPALAELAVTMPCTALW